MLESENFFVVPDAAPIVKGHALIVSKQHSTSAFDGSAEKIREIDRLIIQISNILWKEIGFPSIAWEHASLDALEPSGCIEHAHVHVIPCNEMKLSELKRLVGVEMSAVEDMQNFLHEARSRQYAVFRKSDSHWFGGISEAIPSQCLRMSFGSSIKMSNCTWQKRLALENTNLARVVLRESMQVLCQGKDWGTHNQKR